MQLKILKSMLVWWFVVALLVHAQSAGPSFGHPRTKVQYGQLPLTFEANQGQLPPVVSFVSHAPGYSAYLTSEGMLLSLRSKSAMPEMVDAPKGASNHVTLSFQLRGAAKNPPAIGEGKQSGLVNYFIGRDPSKWHTNVATYAQVRYKNVYQGIDLVYYGDQRQLEYDFEVAPGADPRQIRFAIHGIRHLQVARDGNLLLDTAVGELRFQAPVLYQLSKGQRVAIRGGYDVNDDNTVSFRLDSYDPRRPLIIDPVLVYSSYLGGTGNEQVAGITVDANGNAYVVGSTDSPDFPLTTLGSTTTGNSQVFVAKIDATGSNLLFCDFLGGNSQDNGYGVALDAAHNVFVTGSTASGDFPLVNPFQGTYPGSYNGFLAKISSEGSSLMYSTYFGGNGSDVPVGVAVDTNGSAVIAGYTSSTSLPLSSAFQSGVFPNQGGLYGNYGFVAKFSPDGSSLMYSTYLGGSSNTPFNCGGTPCWPEPSSMVYGLALDVDGNTYVAGTTNTYNFPVTAGAFLSSDSTSMNGSIGFVSKFGNTGNLAYSTYFGDSLLTVITSVAVDAHGSAYVSGLALDDGTFPVTSTTICDPTVYGSACNFAFVSKFDPTAASLVYSTFLGPNNYAVPQAIALDRDNNAYVLAAASSGTFDTVNAIESFDGASDILLVEIDPTGSTQLFATYLGGAGNDMPAPSGMALDAQGSIYLAGTTDSSDFPVMQSAFQTTLAGNSDAFVAKIAAASGAAVALTPVTLAYADETVGTSSQPEDVLLRNMSSSWLSVASLSVLGDFSETDTCTGGVPPAGTCTLSISFSPTASGLRNGSVVITDDASGSPHSINLSGTGLGPSASLTPASLTFPGVLVGSSSPSQLVTLANGGNADLTISSIQISGDFSQTNNCPPTLPAGSSCGINVTFTPNTAGVRSGSLAISDNAPGSPQLSALNGAGEDFSLSSSITSSTVNAGGTATYTVKISPLTGAFSNSIAISCSGAPSTTTCKLSSVSVTPGTNSVSVIVKIATTAPSARAATLVPSPNRAVYALWIQFQALGLFGLVVSGSKRRLRKSTLVLAVLLIASACLLASGCAGGTGIGPQGQPGTTPGTYAISVSGSSGPLHHSLPLTLIVQ